MTKLPGLFSTHNAREGETNIPSALMPSPSLGNLSEYKSGISDHVKNKDIAFTDSTHRLGRLGCRIESNPTYNPEPGSPIIHNRVSHRLYSQVGRSFNTFSGFGILRERSLQKRYINARYDNGRQFGLSTPVFGGEIWRSEVIFFR